MTGPKIWKILILHRSFRLSLGARLSNTLDITSTSEQVNHYPMEITIGSNPVFDRRTTLCLRCSWQMFIHCLPLPKRTSSNESSLCFCLCDFTSNDHTKHHRYRDRERLRHREINKQTNRVKETNSVCGFDDYYVRWLFFFPLVVFLSID